MAYFRRGYIFAGKTGRGKISKKNYDSYGQCVWIVKNNESCGSVGIGNGNITFPKEFVGKRVRLKVEFIDDNEGMPEKTLFKMTKKELTELLKKEFLRGFRSGKK